MDGIFKNLLLFSWFHLGISIYVYTHPGAFIVHFGFERCSASLSTRQAIEKLELSAERFSNFTGKTKLFSIINLCEWIFDGWFLWCIAQTFNNQTELLSAHCTGTLHGHTEQWHFGRCVACVFVCVLFVCVIQWVQLASIYSLFNWFQKTHVISFVQNSTFSMRFVVVCFFFSFRNCCGVTESNCKSVRCIHHKYQFGVVSTCFSNKKLLSCALRWQTPESHIFAIYTAEICFVGNFAKQIKVIYKWLVSLFGILFLCTLLLLISVSKQQPQLWC